jgi:Na+-driven multidrug efflux pump
MTLARARFTTGSVGAHIVAMATASGVGLLAVFLVDILTLLYVSLLHDQTLLAAVGLAKTLLFINSAFTSGMVIAAGVLLSERTGRHAGRRWGQLVSHLLVLGLVIAGAVAALEVAGLAPLSRWLGADAPAYQAARPFLWIALPASVLMAAMQMCAQMLKAQGHIRPALTVLLSGAASLALADPVLIFSCGLGLQGAALSYLLSAGVSLGVGLWLVKRHIGLAARVRPRLLRLHAGRTLRLALPAMLANLAMPVGIVYLTLTLASQGTSALAGMAVIDRVLQLAYCMFFALPGALVPVLAQNLGAGLDARVRATLSAARWLVTLYGVAVWLLLIVCGPHLADYFELRDLGRELFLAFCQWGGGAWILFGLDFVAQAVFFTLGRAWWVAGFGWLRGTLGSLPFIYLGSRGFGANGALLGMWCGNALVATLAIWAAAHHARGFLGERRSNAC